MRSGRFGGLAAAALLFAVTTTSCARAADASPASGSPRQSVGAGGGTPGGDDLATGEVPTELLEAVLADAADRAGVDPTHVEVTIAESVTWSDGSLGCPEPGMMYTPALVPGYRIVVAVDGEEMSFHASQSGDFRFCADRQPPVNGAVDR